MKVRFFMQLYFNYYCQLLEISNEFKKILMNHCRTNKYYQTKGKEKYNSKKLSKGGESNIADTNEVLPTPV